MRYIKIFTDITFSFDGSSKFGRLVVKGDRTAVLTVWTPVILSRKYSVFRYFLSIYPESWHFLNLDNSVRLYHPEPSKLVEYIINHSSVFGVKVSTVKRKPFISNSIIDVSVLKNL